MQWEGGQSGVRGMIWRGGLERGEGGGIVVGCGVLDGGVFGLRCFGMGGRVVV